MSEMAERVGVYVCHCGSNIAGKVDVCEVARWAEENLDDVVVARDYKFMCSALGQALIEEDIRNERLTRVEVSLLASVEATPEAREVSFREVRRELWAVYRRAVLRIPTNRPLQRMEGESLTRALFRFTSGKVASFDALVMKSVLAPDRWWQSSIPPWPFPRSGRPSTPRSRKTPLARAASGHRRWSRGYQPDHRPVTRARGYGRARQS